MIIKELEAILKADLGDYISILGSTEDGREFCVELEYSGIATAWIDEEPATGVPVDSRRYAAGSEQEVTA